MTSRSPAGSSPTWPPSSRRRPSPADRSPDQPGFARATGSAFASAYRGEEHPYATEMAPGLGAPFHQHLFSARLGMAIDGVDSTVHEVDAVRLRISAENP
ncbi:hypothetical protein A7K94_0203270 [Modestobacter sp. VKM Ac-2676]|nr:hypothetical protein A7K94_0203270 [Modestobacter sp. VKM Ac-2676]